MDKSKLFGRPTQAFNRGLVTLAKSPLGKPLRGFIAEISYVGRRSGRTFRTPVGFRRRGADIVIIVALPDAKTWWRNFTGEGGPITMHLDGAERTGTAVARRDERGRVTVTVRLADAPAT